MSKIIQMGILELLIGFWIVRKWLWTSPTMSWNLFPVYMVSNKSSFFLNAFNEGYFTTYVILPMDIKGAMNKKKGTSISSSTKWHALYLVVLFSFHSNAVRRVLHRWRSWCSERLSYSPKVIQLVNGCARTESQVRSDCSIPCTFL